MTTTVYDAKDGIVACDSRWSIPGDFGVLYVDEAPFYKLGVYGRYAFVFAGRAPVIASWKQYLSLAEQGVLVQTPTLEGIAVLVAEMETGLLVDSYQQDIMWPSPDKPIGVFAGTGSTHAASCWIANKRAVQAVETAKNFDICTGGQTRFIELFNRVGHSAPCQGVSSLAGAFLERGMVMMTGNSPYKDPISFKEAAQLDPAIAELYKSAAEGSISDRVQAPCDAIYNSAPAVERERFASSIQRLMKR